MTYSPEILRTPVPSSVIPCLHDGSLKVFPVAIHFFNVPSTFLMKDVYQFARQFGSVEKVSEMHASDEDIAGEVAEEEAGFRVQYRERYNILLILQNRTQLVVDGKMIGAEPLFV